MPKEKIQEIIQKLNLVPHPEGGYYREFYRSDHKILHDSLENYNLQKKNYRNAFTLIYYFLKGEEISVFHKLTSEEIWHFYLGSPLLLHLLDETQKKYTTVILGKDYVYQYVIPKNIWFAAEIVEKKSFSLVGCTVSPGFEFEDFEIGTREILIDKFPEYRTLIERFTK